LHNPRSRIEQGLQSQLIIRACQRRWKRHHLYLNIYRLKIYIFAIDHRTWKTGLPVRSAVLKPCAGRLVVGWVTTSEYLLLIVLHFCPKHSGLEISFVLATEIVETNPTKYSHLFVAFNRSVHRLINHFKSHEKSNFITSPEACDLR
jgi:hypothetical protein